MLKNTILIIHHDEIYRSTVTQFLPSDAYEVLQTDTVHRATTQPHTRPQFKV